jgi:hypothetical protein
LLVGPYLISHGATQRLTDAGTYYWYMYLLNGEGDTLTWKYESGTVTPRSEDVEAVAADKQR